MKDLKQEAHDSFDERFTFLNEATGIRSFYGTGLTPTKVHDFLDSLISSVRSSTLEAIRAAVPLEQELKGGTDNYGNLNHWDAYAKGFNNCRTLWLAALRTHQSPTGESRKPLRPQLPRE